MHIAIDAALRIENLHLLPNAKLTENTRKLQENLCGREQPTHCGTVTLDRASSLVSNRTFCCINFFSCYADTMKNIYDRNKIMKLMPHSLSVKIALLNKHSKIRVLFSLTTKDELHFFNLCHGKYTE